MTSLLKGLLFAGLVFPAISLVTGIGSLLFRWRCGRHSSPIYIPFIGPLLLTSWILLSRGPVWGIAVAWVIDIGTLTFLAASPLIVREWWQTSRFTRILELAGSQDSQSAVLSLHSTGHYQLTKSWNARGGEAGISEIGEPGTFTKFGDRYELVSHVGVRRILQWKSDSVYHVEEECIPHDECRAYALSGWVLRS